MTATSSWTTLSERIGGRLAADADGERAVILLGELFDEVLVGAGADTLPARILSVMRIGRELAAVPNDTPSLDGVAVHEAAHAVFLHRFGYQIADATIDPLRNAGARGVVLFSGYTPRAAFTDDERVRIEQRVMIELSGPVAQEMTLHAHGFDLAPQIWDTHRRDAAEIVRRIPQRLVGDDPIPFVDWIVSRTRSEVRRLWVTIRALADTLLEQRSMPGPAVHEFITDLHRRESAAMEGESSPTTSPSSDT